MLTAPDALQSSARIVPGDIHEWGARIRKLRRDVWRGEGVSIPTSVIWDRHDEGARHWVLHDGATLLGAARLCFGYSIAELPDSSVYEGMPVAVTPPMASIGRLVIHPAIRGSGLSRAFDDARIKCAREQGALTVLVHIFQPCRKTQLAQAGWNIVSEVSQPIVEAGRKHFVLSLTLR